MGVKYYLDKAHLKFIKLSKRKKSNTAMVYIFFEMGENTFTIALVILL